MKTQNKVFCVSAQVIFLFVLTVGLRADLAIPLFGNRFPIYMLFIAIVLPLLVGLSWRAAHSSPSARWRNYFRVFCLLGGMFWLLNLVWIGIFVSLTPN
jgi:hypothetical protein